MSDIFSEVDEEVRREQLKRLWDRWSGVIVAAAVLLVVGVGAWRGWQYLETKKAQEAGAAFETALTLSQEGKHDEALKAIRRPATVCWRAFGKLPN